MNLINPEVRDVQQHFFDLRDRMSKMEGQFEEVQRIVAEASRQTIWQFVVFTLTMAAVFLSGIKYQTDALRNESNARFEAIEKRIEQSERNINARFEDLKQTVLTQRKQTSVSEPAPK